jgi:predicted kinase
VRQRLQGRTGKKNRDNSDADWTVYQEMKQMVEKIRRNHYAVDTSRDITPALDKIVREAMR